MAIIKNEIPILEYDDSPNAVIMPTHENLDIKLPPKLVFPFLMDYVEKYAIKHNLKQVATFISATKPYPVYIANYKGYEVTLCQAPVGSAASTQILDWLIGYGAREIISAGSCGALIDIKENEFLIPTRALRDEGTSYHYLPPSRFVNLNKKALNAIKLALEENKFLYRKCTTWTTDGFFRETREKAEYRKSEGCSVVEMECSALMACAEFRNAIFGQILYTADNLADLENYNERNWGIDSIETALNLCFEAVIRI